MRRGDQCTLAEVIHFALTLDTADGAVRDRFCCLYGPADTEHLVARTPCLLDDPPSVFEDQDVLPARVVSAGLELLYDGQQFIDVIDHARRQEVAGVEPYLRALNHYLDTDDFLDLDDAD